MKKTFLFLLAATMTLAANATILRVSNVSGSSAPYTSIQAAHDDASVGDTIMVDGSPNSYGRVEIRKRVVMIGPGYWLTENGIVDESAPQAIVESITITSNAQGTIIQGLQCHDNWTNSIIIKATNCVVNRCYITGGNIQIDTNGAAAIHQNIFKNYGVDGHNRIDYEYNAVNVQVTNNIFIDAGISCLNNSYIAYNTIISGNKNILRFSGTFTSTIEHNIIPVQGVDYNNIHIVDDNEWGENYVGTILDKKGEEVYSTYKTDKDIRDAEVAMSEGKYGAFAGDSPYVISGIPAGPVIEDLVVPASVEKGSKMNVTIKVGIQK